MQQPLWDLLSVLDIKSFVRDVTILVLAAMITGLLVPIIKAKYANGRCRPANAFGFGSLKFQTDRKRDLSTLRWKFRIRPGVPASIATVKVGSFLDAALGGGARELATGLDASDDGPRTDSSSRMTEAWRSVNRQLFAGSDPYAGFLADPSRIDLQGWNSQHAFLGDTIRSVRPRIVVEVGVWKGASSIHMADAMMESGIDGVIIAVDTFLGSWDHYEQAEWFPSLKLKHGYPTFYETFLTNVVTKGVQGTIQPLPLDSANACFVLVRKGIKADVIHIDAGHDFDAVAHDLRMWWRVLKPGGTMIMDDYDESGGVWPGVRDAVDAFLRITPHEAREAIPYKLRFRKPG